MSPRGFRMQREGGRDGELGTAGRPDSASHGRTNCNLDQGEQGGAGGVCARSGRPLCGRMSHGAGAKATWGRTFRMRTWRPRRKTTVTAPGGVWSWVRLGQGLEFGARRCDVPLSHADLGFLLRHHLWAVGCELWLPKPLFPLPCNGRTVLPAPLGWHEHCRRRPRHPAPGPATGGPAPPRGQPVHLSRVCSDRHRGPVWPVLCRPRS